MKEFGSPPGFFILSFKRSEMSANETDNRLQ